MDGVDYQIAAQNLQKLVPQKHVFWRMDILLFGTHQTTGMACVDCNLQE
jgi:hypothetical protein